MIYTLDSNIISYALKGDTQIRQQMCNATEAGNTLVIPYIVYFEIKRWLLEIGAKNKQIEFERMLQDIIPLEPLEKVVWDEACHLYVRTRRMGRPMDEADLLIAAFAIANDYVLVTNNTRHFEGISKLKFVNWRQG